MSSNSNTDSKAPKLPRITASLDEFDAKIVENLVGYKGQNKSEVIRVIIKEWTAQNTEVIQNEYGISLRDIRKEIELKKENKEMKDLIEVRDKYSTNWKRMPANISIGCPQLSKREVIDIIQRLKGKKIQNKINFYTYI